MPPHVAELIGGLVLMRGRRANLLVFGAGHDSAFWTAINRDGLTCIVEDDRDWAEQVRREVPAAVVVDHAYPTTVRESLAWDIAGEESPLVRFRPPAFLSLAAWDIVVIDGPAGYADDRPGRALPIYWAATAVPAAAHVFVDDCERPLERRYCARFLVQPRRSVVLPSGRGASMLWRLGDPPAPAP
ncbi:MAG: hypothetical protein AB7P02_29080 [Alphaproteobacteria bacterium]